MNPHLASYALRTLQIVWLDLLLSGDNAVVIALACRRLPSDKKQLAVGLGAAAAIALRLAFAAALLTLLQAPFIKLVGALLLVWIAFRLVSGPKGEERAEPAASLWQAVRVIAFADALMSLDNVLAITAAAQGDPWLVLFGLLLSLPLVVFGAAVFVRLLERFSWLLWASAALIGWSAGQMAAEDRAAAAFLPRIPSLSLWAGVGGAVLVVALAALTTRFGQSKRTGSKAG